MDQRNLVLAIVLSIVIMLGYNFVVVPLLFPEQLARQQAEQTEPAATDKTPGVVPLGPDTLGVPTRPSIEGAEPSGAEIPGVAIPGTAITGAETPGSLKSRAEMLATTPRVRIETPVLRGSISLTGGRIDDLVLTQYRETIDSDSPEIVLLSPSGDENPYFADFGWTGRDLILPQGDTLWRTNGKALTPDRPVTLLVIRGR